MPMPEGKRFRFTFIIAVYNAEQYIDEALESLVNQVIGFEKMVQVVFVDDGSTDGSAAVCRRYCERYPDNVSYHRKENGGPASAKNFGLAFAEGELISFMDPDDTLSPTALQQVDIFFNQNHWFVDFATLPIVLFEEREGLHPLYESYKNGRNCIVDLMGEPQCLFFSAAASFYKASLFEKRRFDEALTTAEDFDLNLSLFQEKRRFGYVSAKGAQYNYRIRHSKKSLMQASKKNGTSVRCVLHVLEKRFKSRDALLEFEKEAIAYQMGVMVPRIKAAQFPLEDDYLSALEIGRDILGLLGPEYIWNGSKTLRSASQRIMLLDFCGTSYGFLFKENMIPKDSLYIRMLSAQIESDSLNVALQYISWNYDDLDIVAYSRSVVFEHSGKYDGPGPYDKHLKEFEADLTHVRTFEFPCEKLGSPNRRYKVKFMFVDKSTGEYIRPARVIPPKRHGFSEEQGNVVFDDGRYRLTLSGITLTVERSDADARARQAEVARELVGKAESASLFKRFARSEEDCLIICDTTNRAADNGEALFRYIMETRGPRAGKWVSFAVGESTPDYARLKERFGDHVVRFGSQEHRRLFLGASHVLSSSPYPNEYCPFSEDELTSLFGLLKYQFIWLQSRNINECFGKAAQWYSTCADVVTVANGVDRARLLDPGYFYNEEDVLLTGLARFDGLQKSVIGNTIAVVPNISSWVRGFSGDAVCPGLNMRKLESNELYLAFKGLLSCAELLECLEQSKYEITFVVDDAYTHQADLFKCLENDVVRVVPESMVRYDELVSCGVALVTDSSGLANDFAYLRKPVVYLQPTAKDALPRFGVVSPNDYERSGFGPVCGSWEEAAEIILSLLDDGFGMPEAYMTRVEAAFRDVCGSSCERIVKAALPHMK